MGYISFDGCDVVTDFTLTWSKIGFFAVGINCLLDFGFVLGIRFGEGAFDVVDYLDADCMCVRMCA